MSERLSNEHGHNFSEKSDDGAEIPADPRHSDPHPDEPNPESVPANEGGTDEA